MPCCVCQHRCWRCKMRLHFRATIQLCSSLEKATHDLERCRRCATVEDVGEDVQNTCEFSSPHEMSSEAPPNVLTRQLNTVASSRRFPNPQTSPRAKQRPHEISEHLQTLPIFASSPHLISFFFHSENSQDWKPPTSTSPARAAQHKGVPSCGTTVLGSALAANKPCTTEKWLAT